MTTHTGDEHLSNTWIRLSNDSFVRVPDGADPDFVRSIEENKIYRAAHPLPRRPTTQRTYQSRSRKHNASDGLGCGGSSPFDSAMLATARRMDELAVEEVAL